MVRKRVFFGKIAEVFLLNPSFYAWRAKYMSSYILNKIMIMEPMTLD
jgi:hypothetical protein